jgi:CxxC motif-containing protein (DUF1111 family)
VVWHAVDPSREPVGSLLTPLWGLADRTRFLHDGRADSLEAAILAHGGEAAAAQRRFRSLSAKRRRSLLEFLRTR